MQQKGQKSRMLAVLFLYALPLSLPFLLPAPRHAPVDDDSSRTTAALSDAESQTPRMIEKVDAAVLASVAMPDPAVSGQNRCLAQAIYFEARSETVEGQVAVAQVVLNRVTNPRYPSTICDVVFQNEWRRHRCQFSFACDGRSDNPAEAGAWRQARQVAQLLLTHEVRDQTASATHYHATYVRPYWADRLEATGQVGRHVFYRE